MEECVNQCNLIKYFFDHNYDNMNVKEYVEKFCPKHSDKFKLEEDCDFYKKLVNDIDHSYLRSVQ